MSRYAYTDEQLTFLAKNAVGIKHADLADAFNRKFGTSKSVDSIKWICRTYRIKNGLAHSKHSYTDEQLLFLARHVAGTTFADLAAAFNNKFETDLSSDAIKQICRFYKIKNNIPGPGKRYPLGTEVIDYRGFIMVKVADDPAVWKSKHRAKWEKANGPLPADHVVIFADRNRKNFKLENLKAVSYRERGFLQAHGMHYTDSELTKAAVSLARLIFKCDELALEI